MDIAFTQKNRLLALEQSPLGKDALLLTAFSGQEEISRLFSFQLELLSTQEDLAAKDLVGKPLTFSIKYGDEQIRYYHGFVSRFSASSLLVREMRLYRAEVVPWLWFLTRTADCRIFQNKTVPQIIEQIFQELGFGDYEIAEIKGTHPQRDYCVQYRETDFNFISRLMEQGGIFYWFRHEQNKHTLVLADHKGAYKNLPEKEAEYISGTPKTLVQSHLWAWEHRYEFLPGKWTQTDYNFETPSINLSTSTPTLVDLPEMKNYEMYDYPGAYGKRDAGDQLTRLRMEETEAAYDQVNVTGSYRSFAPGGKFTLKRHECSSEEGKTYLITSIKYEAADLTYMTGEGGGERYSNTFTCIPADVVFRPARITPKPLVQGPQTAVVVGPPGEEIYTDKYGRVKVQFHWDRYGKFDENSSCWVRVSQPSAGKGWGTVITPRIGQEVIMDFLEGDPDRPIITGRVYNANQMPPFGLPGGAVVSGMKSNTHKGQGYNEISMDDTAGNEKVAIHGQHNMSTTVGNDQTNNINNNRTTSVGVDDTQSVGSNRKVDIGSNHDESVGSNKKVSIGSNHDESVGSNKKVSIGSNLNSVIGSNQSTKIGGKQSETVGGSSTVTVGGKRMESVAGGHTFTNPKMGMNVGGKFSVNAGGSITESSPKVNLNAGSKLAANSGGPVNIKAGSVMKQQSGGAFNIKGGSIKEQSEGALNIKAGGALKQQGSNISLKGPTKVAGETKITSETKIKGTTLVVS